MSLKLTGYSAVPRSWAYGISVECSSRHVVIARRVSVPPTLQELAPSAVSSHWHRCVSLKGSVGQRRKDSLAFSGHHLVLQFSPRPQIPIQILPQKVWKSFLVLKTICKVHSVDLMASTQTIKTLWQVLFQISSFSRMSLYASSLQVRPRV